MELLTKFLLTLVVGAVIGLEREVTRKDYEQRTGKRISILGLRDFVLVALLGCTAGLLHTPSPIAFTLLSAAVLIIIIIYYNHDNRHRKSRGITSEMALFFTFFLGVVIAFGVLPVEVILALLVIIVLILSRKEEIKSTAAKLKNHEMDAFVAYALIAIVILPFLPNESYTLNSMPATKEFLSNLGLSLDRFADIELFNPFKLWFVVAVITGIDVIGYLLERVIGRGRGLLVASTVGGFISSTATTQSLAQQSKDSKAINYLLAAALFANMTSFVQIVLLTAPLNASFMVQIVPLVLTITITAALIGFYFLRKKDTNGTRKDEPYIQETEIINIKPALKFAALFLVVRFVSKLAYELFGSSGFLVASGISAMAGLDAIIINTSELVGRTIDVRTGILALIIANAVNLISKAAYCYTQGDKEFAKKFTVSICIIIASSLVGLFL